MLHSSLHDKDASPFQKFALSIRLNQVFQGSIKCTSIMPVGVGIFRLPIESMVETYSEIAMKISNGEANWLFKVKKLELTLKLMVEPESNNTVPSFASGISIFLS